MMIYLLIFNVIILQIQFQQPFSFAGAETRLPYYYYPPALYIYLDHKPNPPSANPCFLPFFLLPHPPSTLYLSVAER